MYNSNPEHLCSIRLGTAPITDSFMSPRYVMLKYILYMYLLNTPIHMSSGIIKLSAQLTVSTQYIKKSYIILCAGLSSIL